MSDTPTTEAGAFDADWLLQPQGEARRLEAALRSFAERGFDGPQYTAWATEIQGCPAYGLRIISQAGEWSPREWVVTATVTRHEIWAGERHREHGGEVTYTGGPTIWTRGRTGESVFEGGARLRARLELPLLRHLAVIGIRTARPGEGSLPGDELWLPEGWEYIPTQNNDPVLGLLYRYEPDNRGTLAASWAYVDDEYGSGGIGLRGTAPGLSERLLLQEVAYHVAGRLAGVEDPHGLYAQRQAKWQAELQAAQADPEN